MESINWFVSRMTSASVYEAIEQLLEWGADPLVCAGRMHERQIAKCADLLEEAGADREILYRLSGKKIPMNPLNQLGDNPSREEIEAALKASGKKAVIKFAVKLYDGGVSIKLIHEHGGDRAIGEHIPEFLKRGVAAGKLVRMSDLQSLKKYRRLLEQAGADPKVLEHEIFLRSKVSLGAEAARALHCEEAGMADRLLNKMRSYDVDDMFDDLIELGYTPRELAAKLDSGAIVSRIEQLLEAGVDAKWLARRLEPVDLLACAVPLTSYGVKVDREKIADQIRAKASDSGLKASIRRALAEAVIEVCDESDWGVIPPDFDLNTDVFDPLMGEDF